MPRGLFPFGLAAPVQATLAQGALSAGGDGAIDGDDLTARAVAFSGLLALLGLPILMLASVALSAPLAAPAAIALGYLAMSYALAARHPRSAAAINALVLAGLLAWLLSFLLAGQELSRAGIAAALLAPLFAAAPAVARLAIAPRADAAASGALSDAACLDRLAPSEAMLVVRRDGTLLAATRAARRVLPLLAEAMGSDVGRCFGLVDRPKLAEAIARCRDGETLEVTLQSAEGRGGGATPRAAEISAAGAGAVSIRLLSRDWKDGKAVPSAASAPRRIDAPRARPGAASEPAADVGEAVAFAVRHAQPELDAKGAVVTSEIEADLCAKSERQICRRIAILMIESALRRSGAGDALCVTGRAVKGVALLRLVCVRGTDAAPHPGAPQTSDDLAALRALVEEAGGTVLIDGADSQMRLSVRLDLAAPRSPQREQ